LHPREEARHGAGKRFARVADPLPPGERAAAGRRFLPRATRRRMSPGIGRHRRSARPDCAQGHGAPPERAARTFPKTHIVAASRPPALGGETVIPGFATIQIGPLDREAVDGFVANWCKALHGDVEKAKQHQAELLDAIRSRPEIEELATNPVMLTALAALHWNRTRLPDKRSELYQIG